MKVLNLQCGQRHSFEGWFASEDDFQSQLVRGLVECPLCADKAIAKMPSAPRLNLGGHRAPAEPTLDATLPKQADAPEAAGSMAASETLPHHAATSQQQAAFLKAVRHVLNNTEDVGERFANEARAMHYGDTEPRSIRGHTTPSEAVELIEEGINVMALPMPAALKETLQ